MPSPPPQVPTPNRPTAMSSVSLMPLLTSSSTGRPSASAHHTGGASLSSAAWPSTDTTITTTLNTPGGMSKQRQQ